VYGANTLKAESAIVSQAEITWGIDAYEWLHSCSQFPRSAPDGNPPLPYHGPVANERFHLTVNCCTDWIFRNRATHFNLLDPSRLGIDSILTTGG